MKKTKGGASHRNTTETPPKPPLILWKSADGVTVLTAKDSDQVQPHLHARYHAFTPGQRRFIAKVTAWGGVGLVAVAGCIGIGFLVAAVWQTLVVGICTVSIPWLSVVAFKQHRHRTRFRDSVRRHDDGQTSSSFKTTSTTKTGKVVNITINNY